MPPRKRASTNTAANGPSKRARGTEEEAAPEAEGSPSGSGTDQSAAEPTPEASAPEASASLNGTPVASAPETNAPETPGSPRQVPRPARFSDVSATANTWQHWRHFVEKDLGRAYTFVCLCRLPHHCGFEELDPLEEVDPEDEDEEERAECDGGETCICETPAAEKPGHKWVLSRAGFRLLAYQHVMTAIRSPDGFGMRTFNDHGAFGVMEVVENLLVDLDQFKDGWRDRWAVCEAMGLYFLGHASEDIFL